MAAFTGLIFICAAAFVSNNRRVIYEFSFISALAAWNLFIVPSTVTNHFPDCLPSFLDFILVTSPNLVSNHGQYPTDFFSYHDLIFFFYILRRPKSKLKVFLRRNFSGMDIDRLQRDAHNINWVLLLQSNSVDKKVRILPTKLLTLGIRF